MDFKIAASKKDYYMTSEYTSGLYSWTITHTTMIVDNKTIEPLKIFYKLA